MKTRAGILWESPGEWSVEEIELDPPGPTELLIEMVATGLCHSDDHFATGDLLATVPIIGGHEGGGIIREVGSQVKGFDVGDHVIMSFVPSCGICKWCARGMQNLCDAGAEILTGTQPSGGYRAHARGKDIATMGALGAFAEWQVVDQLSLIKVAPELPLESVCLVSCGVQTGFGSSITAADVHPGDVVLIMGAGGVGMNAVQGAAMAGARHIVVVDPAPLKMTLAPLFGATEVFEDFRQARRFVKSITNGQGADSAIICIGVVRNEHIGQAYSSIRKAGTVVVTGIGYDREDAVVPGFNAFNVAMFQKRIQGVLFGMASPRDAMPTLIEMYVSGQLKLDELVTNHYKLDDINRAYEDMREGLNIRGVITFR